MWSPSWIGVSIDARLVALAVALGAAVAPLSPAHAQVALRSETIQEREVARGESYSGSVSLENGTDKPARVRLYLTDYTFTADSGTQFRRPGELRRSNARWIVLSGSEIVVPSHGSIPVSYSVRVPSSDSLVGTYWTVMMIESVPERPARDPQRGEVALSTVLRYAVQIVSHIGGAAERNFEVIDPKITTAENGASEFEADIRNAGIRGARLKVRAELFDEDGTKRGQFDQTRGLIYPGASIRQHFTLGQVPAGRYKVLLTLDAGEDALFASQYTFSR